jgi:allantoinase
LRPEKDRQALRERLSDVTTIGSDHSPAPWVMKDQPDFFDVWGGISGCQHMLTLLIDSGIALENIVDLTSRHVARRFRIEHKGEIAIGNDADFTMVDPDAEETITADSLLYRHQHSPYVGRQLWGRIVRTVLRGQTVFVDGKVVGSASGKFVRPTKLGQA